MRGRDDLGEFEHVVILAVLRLGDQANGVTVRREIEARTKREVSIGAVYATLVPGIVFGAPIGLPLSILFVPSAVQLWVVTPLTSSCEPGQQCNCYRFCWSHRPNV